MEIKTVLNISPGFNRAYIILISDQNHGNFWRVEGPYLQRIKFSIAYPKSKIYIIGGYVNCILRHIIECYDIKTNKWKEVTTMPTILTKSIIHHGMITATEHNGNIYILEKYDTEQKKNLLQVYNIENKTWEIIPTSINGEIVSQTVYNDKLCITYSSYTTNNSACDYYDLETKAWVKLSEEITYIYRK